MVYVILHLIMLPLIYPNHWQNLLDKRGRTSAEWLEGVAEAKTSTLEHVPEDMKANILADKRELVIQIFRMMSRILLPFDRIGNISTHRKQVRP